MHFSNAVATSSSVPSASRSHNDSFPSMNHDSALADSLRLDIERITSPNVFSSPIQDKCDAAPANFLTVGGVTVYAFPATTTVAKSRPVIASETILAPSFILFLLITKRVGRHDHSTLHVVIFPCYSPYNSSSAASNQYSSFVTPDTSSGIADTAMPIALSVDELLAMMFARGNTISTLSCVSA